jgi:hypothetical protein
LPIEGHTAGVSVQRSSFCSVSTSTTSANTTSASRHHSHHPSQQSPLHSTDSINFHTYTHIHRTCCPAPIHKLVCVWWPLKPRCSASKQARLLDTPGRSTDALLRSIGLHCPRPRGNTQHGHQRHPGDCRSRSTAQSWHCPSNKCRPATLYVSFLPIPARGEICSSATGSLACFECTLICAL